MALFNSSSPAYKTANSPNAVAYAWPVFYQQRVRQTSQVRPAWERAARVDDSLA